MKKPDVSFVGANCPICHNTKRVSVLGKWVKCPECFTIRQRQDDLERLFKINPKIARTI